MKPNTLMHSRERFPDRIGVWKIERFNNFNPRGEQPPYEEQHDYRQYTNRPPPELSRRGDGGFWSFRRHLSESHETWSLSKWRRSFCASPGIPVPASS